MKRSIVAVTLAVVFVMALAAPAFAQSMTHTSTYEMDGTIDYKRQAGHLCNTGAEHKQTIVGDGEISKTSSIAMIPGRLTMEDTNDYVAGETGLTVTSVIELCAPPKYTYDNDAYEGVVSPMAMYRDADQPRTWYGQDGAIDGEDFAYAGWEGTRNYWDNPDYGNWEAVSDQIWAVQVAADPGYSGNLHQDFEAAYGPYIGQETPADAEATFPTAADSDGWGWQDSTAGEVASVGIDYVGNYFNIDQHARTSMGEVKRFIDISSPWSHAYLHEDMSVVGQSDIEEAFDMTNLAPGADVPGLWYDLF